MPNKAPTYKPYKAPGIRKHVPSGSTPWERIDPAKVHKHQSLYSASWRKARRYYLRRNPLCVQCQKQGRTTAASVVDHVIRHDGDLSLFWDRDNWQALCFACHCVKTARGE